MSQDSAEQLVRIRARSGDVVATRILPLDKAKDFAAGLRRRGWTVTLERQTSPRVRKVYGDSHRG